MHKLHLVIYSVLLLGGLVSCKTQNVDPSGSASVFQSNLTDISEYAVSKGLSGTSTSSGLYYMSTKPSTSTASAAFGKELEFTYTLYALTRSTSNTALITETVADSAFTRTPTFVPFFEGALKAGLEEGLLRMKEGESATLLVPAKLAFGEVASTNGLIPGNSPVRFDVTLNRARTEDQQIAEYLTANKLIPTETTDGGLRFIKTKANPAGDSIKTGSTLTIKYVGRQLHAKTALGFDSTGTGLNQNNVAGFSQGLAKLRTGEKATLIFPSSLGYGAAGLINGTVYKIAPYAPLRYDVEVISVK